MQLRPLLKVYWGGHGRGLAAAGYCYAFIGPVFWTPVEPREVFPRFLLLTFYIQLPTCLQSCPDPDKASWGKASDKGMNDQQPRRPAQDFACKLTRIWDENLGCQHLIQTEWLQEAATFRLVSCGFPGGGQLTASSERTLPVSPALPCTGPACAAWPRSEGVRRRGHYWDRC